MFPKAQFPSYVTLEFQEERNEVDGLGGQILSLLSKSSVPIQLITYGRLATGLFSVAGGSTARTPGRFPASRRYALAAIFGAIVFASKAFAPTPMKDSVIVVQALLLGLGALLLTPFGATLVATIGGLLTASLNPQLALFTVIFAVVYGLLIDALVRLFKARKSETEINAHRFSLAITLSTAIIGFVAYGTTVALGLLPRNPPAEIFILVGGILSGLVGGYLDVVIWRRAARYFA